MTRLIARIGMGTGLTPRRGRDTRSSCADSVGSNQITTSHALGSVMEQVSTPDWFRDKPTLHQGSMDFKVLFPVEREGGTYFPSLGFPSLPCDTFPFWVMGLQNFRHQYVVFHHRSFTSSNSYSMIKSLLQHDQSLIHFVWKQPGCTSQFARMVL